MIKLYKQINSQLHYWETWEQDPKTAVIHWGIVGEKGQNKEAKGGIFSSLKNVVTKEINKKLREGYAPFDEDKMAFLEVVYRIDGFGSEQDLDKRHALEDYLNELLGWTGLGHCDGGSTGSGTMEAGCLVVDFDIAKKVIESNLRDTVYGDFSRIYQMNSE